MHVLTKVFIVLVSLLAILMVPLVVVYAHNEDSYAAKFQEAQARAAALDTQLETAKASASTELSNKEAEIADLSRQLSQLQQAKDDSVSQARQATAEVAATKSLQADINARLAVLASSNEASQELVRTLIAENRQAQQELIAIQRQNIELDEALRERTNQYEVAEQARRLLQEELQEMRDQLAQALDGAGQDDRIAAGELSQLRTPTVTLAATVTDVYQQGGRTYVEINAGEVDGLQVNWPLTIADNGNYIGKIRIVEVDVNSAVGTVITEGAGTIRAGMQARTWAGNR